MNLPASFTAQLREDLPGSEAAALIEAIETQPATVAVRLNHCHSGKPLPGAQPVPWCDRGFFVAGPRPQFTFDPLLHAGLYYVQDASSMFIAHVLRSLLPDRAVRYLDLCAAPGGKATAALDVLPYDSLLVANELITPRAHVLADNITRWDSAHTVVTNDAPRALGRLRHEFDVIATDVPCSGEGMMRKDDEAVRQWTPALVEECAARQREIIDDVWPALRPGGLLIYSTCTYNRAENEDMVDYIVSQHGALSVEVPVDPQWNIAPGIDTPHHCYRFMPHRVQGEGLFMAVLRKPASEPLRRKSLRDLPTPPAVPHNMDGMLADYTDFYTHLRGDRVVAWPLAHAPFIKLLHNSVRVLQSGLEIGTIKGKKHVPAHALVMSREMDTMTIPLFDVDYAQAIAYLRGESITLHDYPFRCHVRIAYRNQVLGVANNLGNRANNLYPRSMRILSTHIPPTPPQVITTG